MKGGDSLTRRGAIRFVVLLGIVSLFTDMTYEGARSLVGPYMVLLGASATVVGVVAGFGELLGYALRFVSDRIAACTGRYWLLTIIGYVLNLVAVPLLALARVQFPDPRAMERCVPACRPRPCSFWVESEEPLAEPFSGALAWGRRSRS